jgi:hypothetical protein
MPSRAQQQMATLQSNVMADELLRYMEMRQGTTVNYQRAIRAEMSWIA